MSDWVVPVVTAVASVIGIYLANSVGRRFRQDIQSRVADKRFESYAALWAETEIAAGMRELTGKGGLTREEREQLADSLTTWYYCRGNGMLLSADTRKIFLEAKHNLVRDVGKLTPELLSKEVLQSSDPDARRGKASLRQVSLLRASMRADLEIYSSPANPTGKAFGKEDREFLRACHVNLNRRPWRPPLRERLFRSSRVAGEPHQPDA